MDLLSFSLELVKILVWPLVVIIGLFAFRRPLEYLIPYLRRVKIKEFEAEFESGIDKINNAEQIIKLPERERKLDISVKALAENYPRAAILEIWTQIESLLKKKRSGEPRIKRLYRRVICWKSYALSRVSQHQL